MSHDQNSIDVYQCSLDILCLQTKTQNVPVVSDQISAMLQYYKSDDSWVLLKLKIHAHIIPLQLLSDSHSFTFFFLFQATFLMPSM